ncbi:MAG: F0F1 ATP synthase subunit delta [Burkholderiales bacterium]|nr:F0F1 ATP synthase subunit delta [Burkholderiales bacterium]
MAEPATIARPYAEAVFAIADESERRAEWSGDARGAGGGGRRPARARGDRRHPNRSAAQAAGLDDAGILAGRLTGRRAGTSSACSRKTGAWNCCRDIRAQYEALRNEREGVLEAEIQSAFALEATALADLVARLEKKTGRKVKASVRLDPELIGGARIRARRPGDRRFGARAACGARVPALKTG